jgi:hypothetical protein
MWNFTGCRLIMPQQERLLNLWKEKKAEHVKRTQTSSKNPKLREEYRKQMQKRTHIPSIFGLIFMPGSSWRRGCYWPGTVHVQPWFFPLFRCWLLLCLIFWTVNPRVFGQLGRSSRAHKNKIYLQYFDFLIASTAAVVIQTTQRKLTILSWWRCSQQSYQTCDDT